MEAKMNKKPSRITEYTAWLWKQYQEAQRMRSPQTLYRLVEIKKTTHNDYELYFQVIGKAVLFKANIDDVLKNENSLEYFSCKDIKTITHLAALRNNKPQNKIVGKSFSSKLNKLIFKIKSLSGNTVYESTAPELSIDKEFIKSLAPEDAHMIGYAAAEEVQEIARQFVKKQKLDQP